MKLHKTTTWHKFQSSTTSCAKVLPHHFPYQCHLICHISSLTHVMACHHHMSLKKGLLGHPKGPNQPAMGHDHNVSCFILYTSPPHVIISFGHIMSLPHHVNFLLIAYCPLLLIQDIFLIDVLNNYMDKLQVNNRNLMCT